jgi:hypothetical protein
LVFLVHPQNNRIAINLKANSRGISVLKLRSRDLAQSTKSLPPRFTQMIDNHEKAHQKQTIFLMIVNHLIIKGKTFKLVFISTSWNIEKK